jgi:hypothetical protein
MLRIVKQSYWSLLNLFDGFPSTWMVYSYGVVDEREMNSICVIGIDGRNSRPKPDTACSWEVSSSDGMTFFKEKKTNI